MPSLHINKITIDTFNKTLVRYSEMIPSTLADLDKFRYDSIPAKLVARNEDAHLLKADVEKLVEWKLQVPRRATADCLPNPRAKLAAANTAPSAPRS